MHFIEKFDKENIDRHHLRPLVLAIAITYRVSKDHLYYIATGVFLENKFRGANQDFQKYRGAGLLSAAAKSLFNSAMENPYAGR